jgi:regulator of RNase E activity RraA
VTVTPGDIVVADDDGVIIVAAVFIDEITTQVTIWADKDSKAREDIRKGMGLIQALDKYGHL